MIVGGKTCPRCAERVKAGARVCRYCGHEFGEPTQAAPGARSGIPLPVWYVAAAALAIAVIVAIGFAIAPSIPKPEPRTPHRAAAAPDAPLPAPAADYPPLGIGEQLEWTAETAAAETVRQVGPYVVRITKRTDDDLVAPIVSVFDGATSVTMVGEAVGGSYTHRIGAVQNIRGAPPVVVLQSFTGGAHCCNHIQVAGRSGGRMKIVDLGSWDGDEESLPTDISGDGIADWVFRDNAFLYAFAPYAMSDAPAQVLNIVNGRRVDVSARPAFRRLYAADAGRSGRTCREGEDGAVRNGACAAYVAAAARTGTLANAWAEMLRSHAADEDWTWPAGCSVPAAAACPPGEEITYNTYPEALLAFLKARGYVARDWLPPEADLPDHDDAEPLGDQSAP